MSSAPIRLQGWALTLGASSGFGEAATRAFAAAGLDVFGVHLDKKATLGHVERIVADLRGLGRSGRRRAPSAWSSTPSPFGALRPYLADPVKDMVTAAQMDMTLDVKATLESHVQQLAVVAPLGITANAIRAGVTDTPAARKIPAYEALANEARRRNPGGRLTTLEEVARARVVLAHPDTHWITGNVIGVDGGEDIVG